MKKTVKTSIKNFAKNVKVLSKEKSKKLKGGVIGVDLMDV